MIQIFALKPLCVCVCVQYLFHVIVESDTHAFLAAQHFAGHECVEDPSAGQRQAEVESKQPPVLHILVELRTGNPNPQTGRERETQHLQRGG